MLAKIPFGGNIIAEKRIGSTHIFFCDAAYIKNTPEEKHRVLREAAQASLNIIVHHQAPGT